MENSPPTITYSDRPWVKSYDKGVPGNLTYPKVPLHQFLQDTAKRIPNNTALITTAKVPLLGRRASELTYSELERASDSIAAALVDMGLKKGDRVAIVMPNCVAFAMCFFGILKAGGVVAATNPTYPPDKMQYQLNDCDAEFVFTLSLFYDLLKKLQPSTKVKKIIVSNIKEYLPPVARV